jgi:hypothetical protein
LFKASITTTTCHTEDKESTWSSKHPCILHYKPCEMQQTCHEMFSCTTSRCQTSAH